MRIVSPAPMHGKRARLVGALALSVALASVALSAARAQSPLPAGSPGRFTMYPADGGIIRLDTQSGTLSMCKLAAGSWACALMPDDRIALGSEIDKLKGENADLKASVKRLEDLAGVPGADPSEGKKPGMNLPTEEEVDKAMNYVQRMLKKFKEKLRELEDPDNPKRTRL